MKGRPRWSRDPLGAVSLTPDDARTCCSSHVLPRRPLIGVCVTKEDLKRAKATESFGSLWHCTLLIAYPNGH